MKKILSCIWAPLLIALVIFMLCCLLPSSDIPKVEFNFFIGIDKVVHFVMFFALAAASSFSYIYVNKGSVIILRMLIYSILFPIIFGGLIELYQAYFTIDRSGDWFDLLADAVGALATIPFALYLRRFMLNRN